MESSGRKDGSACSSSIRTKQLFHEMKQKFPTASDDIVNDCVLRHTDRATCVALLQRHVDAAQAQLAPSHLPRPSRTPSSPTIHVTERSFAEATPSPDTAPPIERQSSRFSTEITIPPREPREAFEEENVTPRAPRRYTSVKFNLKDVNREAEEGNGSVELVQATNFTYSSSSLDNEQGYQSRLHINVGRNGGVISAVRTRPSHGGALLTLPETPTPPVQYQPAHSPIPEDKSVNNQLRIKNSLQNEFVNDQKRLVKIQKNLESLREPFSAESSQRVLQEITQLRCDCERMARAVEKYGPYVLGETNEAFYDNIYTGQKLPAQVRRSRSTRISQSTSEAVINHHIQVLSGRPSSLTLGPTEGSWTCCLCTFANEPLMDRCELCEMPRFSTPSPAHATHVFQMAGFNSYHESVNGSLF